MKNFLVQTFVASFIFIALFGVSLSMPTSHHTQMPCPFAGGCVTPLKHMQHWQSAFAAAMNEIVALFALFFLCFFTFVLAILLPQTTPRILHDHVPRRPSFLEELFAKGILNRKEPYAFAGVSTRN